MKKTWGVVIGVFVLIIVIAIARDVLMKENVE